ncbi:MAG: EamA family transporter [Paludibacteraceae bacterium]
MWVLLAILSALCLGFYDVSKKRALQRGDVLTVLAGSVCISALILCVPLLLSRLSPEMMEGTLFFVPRVNMQGHLLIFAKSCIVLSSWIFAYISVKYLPLSVVSPMQATRPMWTLVGAMLIFGERLNGWQWAGVVCALGSIFLFSLTAKTQKEVRSEVLSRPVGSRTTGDAEVLPRPACGEGVKGAGKEFSHPIATNSNTTRKYYLCLLLAILIGAGSGLYDKYMMRHYDHNAVQVYYTIYQALMMLVIWLCNRWRTRRASKDTPHPMVNRRLLLPVACISLFLVLSDYVYMLALSDPSSMIAIVSTIRRGGTIIPFLYGILILKEPNAGKKIACLTGIVIGLLCLALGSL